MNGVIIFSFIYVGFNFLLSLYLYNSDKKFYDPKFIEINENGITKKINLHEKYHPFAKHDKLLFWKIFIGLNLFFWIKFIVYIIINISLIIILALVSCFQKESRRGGIAEKAVKISLWFVIIISLGIKRKIIRERYEEIYKKYLGKDYSFSFDEGYSLIVSNHTSWLDIACYLQYFACGFIAKAETINIPLIGKVAEQINCLFVNREDSKNRHVILEKIQQRQQEFMNQKDNSLSPLLVFPEGTTTSGKHLIKFKKGAFNSLLPVKPIVMNTVMSDEFHLSCSNNLLVHLIRSMCRLYSNVTIYELPVITPNDYMFENYSKAHPNLKEKWEIYAEVVRDIMSEASGYIQKSEMELKHNFEYEDYVIGKKKKDPLLNEETPNKNLKSD